MGGVDDWQWWEDKGDSVEGDSAEGDSTEGDGGMQTARAGQTMGKMAGWRA